MVIIIIIYIIEFIIVINNLIYLILGINEKSILFELQSIEFSRSFPIDIMHLFFENVASHMFKLWSNQFFKDNSNILSFILPKSSWEEIGQKMNENKKNILLEFGRPLCNIFKHHVEYKAKEWANWITLYSVSLLKSHLQDK